MPFHADNRSRKETLLNELLSKALVRVLNSVEDTLEQMSDDTSDATLIEALPALNERVLELAKATSDVASILRAAELLNLEMM